MIAKIALVCFYLYNYLMLMSSSETFVANDVIYVNV